MTALLVLTAAGCAAAMVLVAAPTPARAATATPQRGQRLWIAVQQLRGRLSPRPARVRQEVAQLLRHFAALLVSGRSEAQAWSQLHDLWRTREPDHPLRHVTAQIAGSEAAGTGTADGLRRYLATDAGSDPELNRLLHRLLAVTALSEQTGAPLSELVEQLAESVDEAAELAAAVETAIAGPTLTQLILTLLPVGGLALGHMVGADPLAMLLGSWFGLVLLGAGLLLLGCGRFWSRHMIQRVRRYA